MFVGFLPNASMLFTSNKDLRNHLENKIDSSLKVGFVPTMGALHDGHLALMDQAVSDNDVLVVSIFVNPTQFNNKEDLEKYPRELDKDIELIEARIKSDYLIIYAPDVQDVYGSSTVSKPYDFDGLEHVMEGAQRPGHFDGVGTILEFLFNAIQPDKAYFGEKDFQQLQIIKKLVKKLDLDLEIIGCPIHREKSGLAMSSRNGRLSKDGFIKAAQIHSILLKAKSNFQHQSIEQTVDLVSQEIGAIPEFTLEYFTIADEQSLTPTTEKDPSKTYRGFIVVHLEGVRLIDNIPLD